MTENFIKNFVPWAKIKVTHQTIFEWWMTRILVNQITKEIDKKFLKDLKELSI